MDAPPGGGSDARRVDSFDVVAEVDVAGEASIPIKDHALYPVLMKLLETQRSAVGLADDDAIVQGFEQQVGHVCIPRADVEHYLTARIAGITETMPAIQACVQHIEQAGALGAAHIQPALAAIDAIVAKRQAEAAETEGRRKAGISARAQGILVEWVTAHVASPYPDDDQKDELILRTGLTWKQLNNWLVNARRRMVPRLLAQRKSSGV